MTKQVALSEHAYARLRRQKLPGESFSGAVERLIDHQRKDAAGFIEAMRGVRRIMSPDEHLAMIEADREASREPA